MTSTYEGNFTVKAGLDTLLNGEGTITSNGFLKFTGQGTSDTFITLSSTQTTNKLISFPTPFLNSDTVVLRTSSDTLLNKNITSSTNIVYAKGFKTSSDTTLILNTSTPTIANQVLTYNGTNNLIWQTVSDLTTAGGSTGQMQYNLSNVLTGATNFVIDSSDSYPIIQGRGSDLATAPTSITNGVKIYGLNRANRTTLSQIDRNLTPTELQPAIYTNKIGWWSATGNNTSPSLFGFDNTSTGTLSTVNPTTTSAFTMMRRLRFSTLSTAESTAGPRSTLLAYNFGTNNSNGGYYYCARFGFNTFQNTGRIFIGMQNSDIMLGSANPSTFTNMIGFGKDASDTTWQFMHGGSAITKVNTGLTISIGEAYEIRIFAVGGSTTVGYSVEEFDANNVISGSVTGTFGTSLPSATTLLAPQMWVNTGPLGGNAMALDVSTQYIETQY